MVKLRRDSTNFFLIKPYENANDEQKNCKENKEIS